jgi:hypothetical protein
MNHSPLAFPFWITCTPNPTPAPGWVLVCYDFTRGATSPVTLLLHFDTKPTAGELEIECSAEEPCQRVYVPPGCTGIAISDLSEQSSACAVSVTP